MNRAGTAGTVPATRRGSMPALRALTLNTNAATNPTTATPAAITETVFGNEPAKLAPATAVKIAANAAAVRARASKSC